MVTLLDYHKEKAGLVLSLRYVTPSLETAENVIEDLQESAKSDVKVRTQLEEHSFETTLYAIYAAESHPKAFPEDWDAHMSKSDGVLVDSVVNTFRGVKEEWEIRDNPLNYYKKPNPTRIQEAFENVEWCQDVPTVGGEIMSWLILKHGLPNANHRTAVAYLRTYLQSVSDTDDPEFAHAGNYQGEWDDWAREHVFESKRLLMLRRRPELLQYAKQNGVETVRRKSGVEVDLTAHDFTGTDMQTMAEQGHRNRCIQFTIDLLERSDYEGLKRKQDDGRSAFYDRLK